MQQERESHLFPTTETTSEQLERVGVKILFLVGFWRWSNPNLNPLHVWPQSKKIRNKVLLNKYSRKCLWVNLKREEQEWDTSKRKGIIKNYAITTTTVTD